jgi:hypothetical protein
MSPSPTVSATPATPPAPAPLAPSLAPDDFANLVTESEDRNTLIGVSAMNGQLLSQAVGYLAKMAAPSSGTGQTMAVTLDSNTVTAIGTAVSMAVATAFQHQLDAANSAIADLKKSRTDDETHIVQLQTAASTLQQEVQTLTVHFGRQEEHTRQAQEILSCQVRELREEVMCLIEVECREPCGKLMAEIELLAARLGVCEAALPKQSRRP